MNISLLETSTRLKSIFLHFFDTHFIEDKGRVAITSHFRHEMRLATRMAVATADTVFIPAASYFESDLCRSILNELEEFIGFGVIVLLGSSVDIEEYVLERQDEGFYRVGSAQYDWYRVNHALEQLPPYQRRNRSATSDIANHWHSLVDDDTLIRRLHDAAPQFASKLENRLEAVPEELGGLAFIPEHVYEILDMTEAPSLVKARVRDVINQGYFESYVRDLQAGVVTDLKYLSSAFSVPSYGSNLSYARMLRLLLEKNRLQEFDNCPPSLLGPISEQVGWQVASQMAAVYQGELSSPAFHLPIPSTRSLQLMTSPHVPEPLPPLKILCVAVAQVELETLRTKFAEVFGSEPKARFIDVQRNYSALKVVDPQNSSEWYLSTLSQQGNIEASGGVASLYHALQPSLVLMVGMCMGMPSRGLEIGTVIIPTEVVGLDHERIRAAKTQTRPHFSNAINGFQRLARIVAAQTYPYKIITDKAVASASAKVEDPNADIIRTIEESFPDVIAFDMESFGFYRGLPDGAQCLWIKGVADNAEQQEDGADGRQEKQVTQRLATQNAGDFAVSVVRAYFDAG